MPEMLFDTQKMVERLETAGVPPVQARTHIAVLAEVANAFEASIAEHSASKQDLARLECEMNGKLADLKSELIRWVSVGILQTAVVAALVLKLLP